MGTPASFSNPNSANPAYGGASGLGAGSLPEIPTPEQIAPDVMRAACSPGANAGSTCPAPVPPCVNGPMLHTHTIAVADPMAPIPSPQQLAPHVFFKTPPASAQPPAQPQQPQPRAPQQQPPQQPQQPPPQQQQPKAPQPAQQNQQQGAQPKAPLDEFDGAFSDEVVKNLNRQLNDRDEGTRASAATDFCNILQKHPKLAESPAYKEYVDAFMVKIMTDPSSLVRGVGEMTLQLGLMQNLPDAVVERLRNLAKKDDANLTKENDQASSIMTGWENHRLGKDLIDTREKKDAAGNGQAGAAAKGQSGAAGGQNQAGAQTGTDTAAQGQTGANATQSKGPGDASAQAGQDASATSQMAGVAGGAPPTPAPPDGPTGNEPASSGAAGNDPSAAGAAPSAAQPGQDAQAAQAGQASPAAQAPQDPSSAQAGAVAQKAAAYGIPSSMATGGQQAFNAGQSASASGGGVGHKLNLWSQSPKSFLPSWLQPHTGQRLNMVEGQA